jgi:nitroreductase
MDKPAITNLEIHPVIKKRWSPRSFQPNKHVEPEKLQRIFDAARWAPSSFNEQPWRFIVGTRGAGSKPDETWEKLYGTLAEFNQKWAHLAPVLVITLGKKTYTKNGNPSKVYKYDLGASAAYMTFQAYSEGLVMHQMGGFDKEKAIEAFEVPGDYEPVTAIAIGYQDVPEKLIPEMEKSERAPRSRHELDQLVFSGRFGRAFPFPKK